jgi:hypothetical protein
LKESASLIVALLRQRLDTLMHLASVATSISLNILEVISLSNLTKGSLLALLSASSAILFFASLEGEVDLDPAGVMRSPLPLDADGKLDK